MAVQIEMTEDVRKYNTKIFGPFTARQLKFTLIGVGCALPGLIFPNGVIAKLVVFLLILIPFLLCGYITYYSMTFDKLVLRVLYLYVLTPRKRKYKRINHYRVLLNELEKQEEKKKIASMQKKEKTAYEKSKKTKITYSNIPEYKIYR
jgi:hypothetical protein